MRRFASLAFVCLAVGLWSAAPASAEAKFGVYRGGGNTAGVAEFEAWAGRPVDVAVDFLAQGSWTDISRPTWWASRWGATRYQTVYSVPMYPQTGGTLAEGATGAYNSHFDQLARTLVAHGEGDSIIRLGWEFNLSGSHWNAAVAPAAFVSFWRQVVNTMRAVPGAQFRFDWCPNRGRGSIAPDTVYPGDAYVDYIGMDSYDTGWAAGWQDPVRRWQTILTEPYGLNWHRDFSRSHGKPMSYPEWGLWVRPDGHGGGDAPYYIAKMHEWFAANNVGYQAYFEFDAPDGQHRLMSGQFPLGASAFKSLFAAPAPPPTPPPPPPPTPPPPPPTPPPPPPTPPPPPPTPPPPPPPTPPPAPPAPPPPPPPAPQPAPPPPVFDKRPVKPPRIAVSERVRRLRRVAVQMRLLWRAR